MSLDFKDFVDLGAVGTAVAAFFDFLPHVAALLSVVWLTLRVMSELKKQGYMRDGNSKARVSDSDSD